MLSEKTKGYIAIISVMVIIGFSFLLVKISLVYTSPLNALTHRFIIAFIGILPIATWKYKELKFDKKDISALLFMAFLYPILSFGLQIWGLSYITSAEAGVIQAIQPSVTMVAAVLFLREIISIRQRLFALLSTMGVLFIFVIHGIGEFLSAIGYILVFLSVVAMSIYSVHVRKLKNRFSVFRMTFFCIFTGSIFFTLLSIGNWLLGAESTEHFFKPLSQPKYLVAVLYLGLLSSLVTLALTNYSYVRIEASKLGVFGNLVPVIAIFAGVIIMGDFLSLTHIVGIILIFAGILGVNLAIK